MRNQYCSQRLASVYCGAITVCSVCVCLYVYSCLDRCYKDMWRAVFVSLQKGVNIRHPRDESRRNHGSSLVTDEMWSIRLVW